jgi:hypothetical protein
MTIFLNTAITTAVTGQVGQVFQVRGRLAERPAIMSAQATVAGTLGTTIQWWLQTSLDQGLTWCDALSFSHTTAGRAAGAVCSTPSTAAVVVTDGAAASGFVQAGLFGNLWRVKYTTTGTWTAGNLKIDVDSDGIVSTNAS